MCPERITKSTTNSNAEFKDIDFSSFRTWLNTLPKPLFNSRVTLKQSSLHGQGLHATSDIVAGEILVYDQGLEVDQKVIELAYTLLGHENGLRIDWDKYLIDAPLNGGAYLNHSCDPNVGFANDRTMVAIKDIGVGEEIVLDYATSEVANGWQMPCGCGASNCREIITGDDHNLQDLQERLGKWFSPFLQRHHNLGQTDSLWAADTNDPKELLARWVASLPQPVFSSRVTLSPSQIHGQGLHAIVDLKPGEIVVVDQGIQVPNSIVSLVSEELDHQNDLPVGWHTSLLDASVNGGAYANHSCEPNIALANERTFVVIKDVVAGEELSPDYGTFAADEDWTLSCCCGAKGCRGVVSGEDHTNADYRSRMGEWFSPYLKEHWGL